MEITFEMLKGIAPAAQHYQLLKDLSHWLNIYFPMFNIDEPGEVRHFLSQGAEETDSFNTLQEYASGKAYDGRLDLGNELPGDGMRFKGRGIFQTTGRANYKTLTIAWKKQFGNSIFVDFEYDPGLLIEPQYAVWSACKFWDDHDLNIIADKEDNELIFSKRFNKKLTPIEYVTSRINGGFNGLEKRKMFYERAKKIIGEGA